MGATRFSSLFLRDLAVTVVVVAGWWIGADATRGDGPGADLVGVVLGFGGGLVAFLAHEWGHFVGALVTRSRVRAPATLTSPYLFSFDSRANSQLQFVVMSLAGFAVTAIAVVVAYGLLPDGNLAARVTRGLVLFSTGLTLFLEVPLLTISIWRGSILKEAEVFPARDDPAPSH